MYIEGNDMVSGKDEKRLAYKKIGFCPQQDPLLPFLRGRDHLLIYGKVSPPDLEP